MQNLKIEENSRAFRIFLQAYKSPRSKYLVKYPMREFLRYANLANYDQIIQLEPSIIETILENWIMDQDQRGLKGSTIRTRLSVVETFLDMNRVVYHKRLLSRLIPSDGEELGGSVAFTHYEIRAMLGSSKKIRTKALIHFLASTGIRPGALIDPILTIKHLKDMPNSCKAIKVYDQSKEGYWTFLTPEATKVLNQYLTSRKLNGECLNEDSPIFANIYDARYGNKQNLSDIGLRQILYRALKASGISRTKSKQRFDKAVIYGFRKRFNTILKLNNNVNSNITEKLMAHKRGLDGTYLTPTMEECFAEFVKAIPDLTLDESERLKVENSEKTRKITELERMTEEAKKTEKELQINEVKIKSLEETTRQLSARLQKQESMTAEINQIHFKIKETVECESDPSNPNFPDGGPYDTRLINLSAREIDEKSMKIFDSEFEESINVVLRKDRVYCTLDKSITCKHVLFALGNSEFYQIVKKNNIDIPLSTVISRTQKICC